MRLSSIVLSAVAFISAGGASYFGAMQTVDWIENSSLDAVERRLVLEGHDWASVQTDGLQVILEGEAPSEADRFKAIASAGSIVEAARVIDAFTVQAAAALAAPDFSLEILRNESGISLIGLIPTESGKDQLLSKIRRLADGTPVSDFLETADYDSPQNWNSSVNFGLFALERLDRTKISIDPTSVIVNALSDSEAERRKFETELARALPQGIKSEISISSPRPVISPFILRVTKTDGVVKFDACSVDSKATETKILAAAVGVGFEDKANCQLALGAPSSEWGKATALGISALAELDTATVTFSDADVTLTADPTTDAATFDRVTSRLKADLPETFILTSVLPKIADTDTNEGPAEFLATLSPEGQLQLRGLAGTSLSQTAAQAFAMANFGSDRVFDATKSRDAVPAGWPIRVMASLQALSHLKSGLVEVSETKISVTGRSKREDTGERISQIFGAKLPVGADFDLELTHVPDLVPVDTSLDPITCVSSINTLIEKRKIVFDPGSTNLNSESRDTVDQIAEILKKCPEASIEIAGHTDSQGGEEMNLNLSNARAKAVLVALKFQRVRNAGITAQGYGESQPIADNDTADGRDANRRIEFRLTDATSAGSTEEATE